MGTIVIDEKYDKWRKMLKEDINRKRYIHSIGVSNTSACLAMRYGCDVWKAYVAGLLHDCAKGLSEEEMIRAVTEADIELSEIEKSNPELLHAKAGSVLARSKYEINDDDSDPWLPLVYTGIYMMLAGAVCLFVFGKKSL